MGDESEIAGYVVKQVREHGDDIFSDSSGGPRIAQIVGPGTPNDRECTPVNNLSRNVIILIEIEANLSDWTLPFDVDILDIQRAGSGPIPYPIGSRDGKCLCVVFADGAIWQLSKEVPSEVLLKYLIVDQSKNTSREIGLARYICGQ